jgi:hypothetical protein
LKWEFRVETIDKTITTNPSAFENALNKFGSEGWEVITMEYGEKASKPHTVVLMKRSIPEKVADEEPILLEEQRSSSLSSDVE